MKYQKKPVIVDAVQWNKHGDHPEVEKCTIKCVGLCCIECGKPYTEHGQISLKKDGPSYDERYVICPGDWIVTYPGDQIHPYSQPNFDSEFETVYGPSPIEKALKEIHQGRAPRWPSRQTREAAIEVYGNYPEEKGESDEGS